jgi:hypothetical protein
MFIHFFLVHRKNRFTDNLKKQIVFSDKDDGVVVAIVVVVAEEGNNQGSCNILKVHAKHCWSIPIQLNTTFLSA